MDNENTSRMMPLDLESEMKTSFISYAMAVIINRALPDVRDGLKPVHRRILFAMDELALQPEKQFRKSARIVGDVIGKYHPHGDSAVYESMVRMAQDFSMRYPLVLGQGNFGSVDGDSPAAMRYTEVKMTKLAMELLSDLDKNTVDFYPNYDETMMQPSVLPCSYPNLLVNGSGGIAVGMATNIPPHNFGETIDALVALIDNAEISIEELMTYLPAPDFPTGGIIMGTSGVKQAYRTGRGRVLVRARAEIEEFGNKTRIVVTELPYQVNKARMVERIAELVKEKKIEGISDLRDESDRHGMRVVMDMKRDANANVVLNQLYKHTSMQETFGIIMLALVDGTPKVLNLKEVLGHYLEFRKEVITRRTRFDLERAKERLHILEGLLRALDCIDEIIALIKRSENANAAKIGLMSDFAFSEKQAQAILDMRLQRLTGLERGKIMDEKNDLKGRVEYLSGILDDEEILLKIIRDESIDVKSRFNDPRRTEITQMVDDIDLDDIIEVEDMVVTMSHNGYIKRVPQDTYKIQNRGGKGVKGQSTHETDFVDKIFVTSTHSFIMFFTNRGRAYKIKCYNVPEAGRNSKGMAIVNLLALSAGEKVTAIFPVTEDDGYLVMATRLGIIKKTPLGDFDNIRKGGIIALTLKENDDLIGVTLSNGEHEFLVGTRNGQCIRFSETDVRPMGRTAAGVRSISLDDDDEVVDVEKIIEGATVLSVTKNGMGKRTREEEYRLQRRGGKGIIANSLTDKTGDLACLKMCTGDEDLILITDEGIVTRIPVSQISVISRNTQGVKLMNVGETALVAGVAIVPHDEDELEIEIEDEGTTIKE